MDRVFPHGCPGVIFLLGEGAVGTTRPTGGVNGSTGERGEGSTKIREPQSSAGRGEGGGSVVWTQVLGAGRKGLREGAQMGRGHQLDRGRRGRARRPEPVPSGRPTRRGADRAAHGAGAPRDRRPPWARGVSSAEYVLVATSRAGVTAPSLGQAAQAGRRARLGPASWSPASVSRAAAPRG